MMKFLQQDRAPTKPYNKVEEGISEGLGDLKTEETTEETEPKEVPNKDGDNFADTTTNTQQTNGEAFRTDESDGATPSLCPGSNNDPFQNDGTSGSTAKRAASWPPNHSPQASRQQISNQLTITLANSQLYSPLTKVDKKMTEVARKSQRLIDLCENIKKIEAERREQMDTLEAERREQMDTLLAQVSGAMGHDEDSVEGRISTPTA